MGKGFDEYAPAYDAWFLENRNVLYSEINLVAHCLLYTSPSPRDTR